MPASSLFCHPEPTLVGEGSAVSSLLAPGDGPHYPGTPDTHADDQPNSRHRLSHRRRADARGRERWSRSWPRYSRRESCALPRSIRHLPFGGSERAAWLRRHGGGSVVRSARAGLRCRRDLLQQRRISRHVRARHHRIDGDPGASGTDQTRPIQYRYAVWRGHGDAPRQRRGERAQCAQLPSRCGCRRRCARIRPGAGRRGVGRQLVLPDQPTPHGACARQAGRANRLHLGGASGAYAERHHRRRRSRDRSHRTVRTFRHSRRSQQELRALSGQGLRSLSLWNGHQREARLPLC